jgi:hypothetical protein
MPREEFEKLNDDNWAVWSYRMEMLLTKMELWDVVSGDTTKPTGAETHKTVIAFRKKQRLARAEIALRVEDLQLVHTRVEDPVDIWKKLQMVHEAHGLGTRMSLRRRFHSMVKADGCNIQTWLSTVEETARRLRHLGSEIDDEEIILVITRGLHDSYEPLIVALDSLDPAELTLPNVARRLLNEEARRAGPDGDRNETALKAYENTSRSRGTRRERTCFSCRKPGHFARECPEGKEERRGERDEKAQMAFEELDFAY